MHTYGLFMLKFDRKQQNSVKQLSFNKKINLKNAQEKMQQKRYKTSTLKTKIKKLLKKKKTIQIK